MTSARNACWALAWCVLGPLALFAALVAPYATGSIDQPAAPAPPAAEVLFAPGTGPRLAILREIGQAREVVLVAAYVLTDDPIAAALLAAHDRGVKVRVILDAGQARGSGSDAARLAAAGIDTYADARHPIMHDKFLVIDTATVLTGSYNFSGQASRNAENLVILRGPELAMAYDRAWHEHARHVTTWDAVP